MVDVRQQLENIDQVFDALAHASRRQIMLTVWFRGGVVSSSEIAKRFHHAWPTISRHLKVLQSAGLLILEREGRHCLYRVNEEKLDVMRNWLKWFDEKPASKEEKPGQ